MEIIHRINRAATESSITQDAYNEGLITRAEYVNKMVHEWVSMFDDLTRHVEEGGHLYVAVTTDNRFSLQYTERDHLDAIKRAMTWANEEKHKHVYVIYVSKGYLKDIAVINKGVITL